MSEATRDRLEPKDSDTKLKLRAKLESALAQLKEAEEALDRADANVAVSVGMLGMGGGVAELLAELSERIESLAGDTDRPSAPQTPEQWSRCLREILLGREWELMTWR